MKPIDYFKLQAKNLHKDFSSKEPYFDKVVKDYRYNYRPKYFDIDAILCYFDIDEDNFSLMKAQHFIAQIVGFEKWTVLAKASDLELDLAKLLFDNQHKISFEDWKMYIDGAEYDNRTSFDAETRMEIFETVFLNLDGHESNFPDFRMNKKII